MTLVSLALFIVVAYFVWNAWNKPTPYTHDRPATDEPAPTSRSSGGDNWEGSFWEVEDPIAVAAALNINYVDGQGQRTSRTIDVHKFGEYKGSALIIAWCRLRDANRTFRADRISKCIDIETGEIVQDVGSFLRARYEASPEAAIAKFVASDYDAVRVLLYVGKADGQLRAEEKEIICRACADLSQDSRMTMDLIQELFSTMDVPTMMAFKQAVGRLSKRDSEVQKIVLSAAHTMVATQKTVHSAERDALDYMQTRFKMLAGG